MLGAAPGGRSDSDEVPEQRLPLGHVEEDLREDGNVGRWLT